ncbi:hypothetical protein GUG45_22535, partial [Xanthomonas citri pv. citri]|nr:hypothetical protein [Xanthomonas citri pv. citri]
MPPALSHGSRNDAHGEGRRMNINRRDTTLTALTAISLALANAASAQ